MSINNIRKFSKNVSSSIFQTVMKNKMSKLTQKRIKQIKSQKSVLSLVTNLDKNIEKDKKLEYKVVKQ